MNCHITPAQARAVLEDCLTNLGTSRNRGIATGTAGGFYMAGIISEEEWKDFLKRIPPEPMVWDSTINGVRA